MTAQEAIKIRNNPTIADVDSEELSKCINEVLEKQIPKKVVFTSNTEFLRYCPCCNVRFIAYGMKYCSECGQALDWGE